MPPFFQRIALVRVFHVSVLALTYGLSLAFYPDIARGVGAYPYFSETYFGGIGASIALSVLALFFGPGMRLYRSPPPPRLPLHHPRLQHRGLSLLQARPRHRPHGGDLPPRRTAPQSRDRGSGPRRPCRRPSLALLLRPERPRRLDATADLRPAFGALPRPRDLRSHVRLDRPPGGAPEGPRRHHPHPGGQSRRPRGAQPQPSRLRENRRRRVLGCASETA